MAEMERGYEDSPLFLYRVPPLHEICKSMLEGPIALKMGSKLTGPSMQASREMMEACREPEATRAANQSSTVVVTWSEKVPRERHLIL